MSGRFAYRIWKWLLSYFALDPVFEGGCFWGGGNVGGEVVGMGKTNYQIINCLIVTVLGVVKFCKLYYDAFMIRIFFLFGLVLLA